MVGYTGGDNEAATYQSVCRGTSPPTLSLLLLLYCGQSTDAIDAGDGHTEGIRLWYDEAEVTYGELLAKFFKEHDVSESLRGALHGAAHPGGTDANEAPAPGSQAR